MSDIEGVFQMPNNYKKEKKKLKVEAFHTFHQCKLKCLEDIQHFNEKCPQRCEIYLDKYQQLYKDKAFQTYLWLFKFKGVD